MSDVGFETYAGDDTLAASDDFTATTITGIERLLLGNGAHAVFTATQVKAFVGLTKDHLLASDFVV